MENEIEYQSEVMFGLLYMEHKLGKNGKSIEKFHEDFPNMLAASDWYDRAKSWLRKNPDMIEASAGVALEKFLDQENGE